MNTATLLINAVRLATQAHDGQVRKPSEPGGYCEPYINHPIRVAAALQKFNGTLVSACKGFCTPDEAVAAALLHDVLEDCPDLIQQDVVTACGPVVGSLVALLTNHYTPETCPGDNRETRKANEASRLASAPPIVQLIKEYDRADNLDSWDPADPFLITYLAESIALGEAMSIQHGVLADAILLAQRRRAVMLQEKYRNSVRPVVCPL